MAPTTMAAQPQQRVVRGPQRGRGAVAVAGRDRQRRAARHRHAGVADDLREGAQPHDLGAQPLGHVGGGEQPLVGELGRVAHDLVRRAADADQPALGLDAGRAANAGHGRVDERRRVGHHLLERVHEQRRRDLRQDLDRLDDLEVLLRQRMDHEREAVDALEAVRVQDARRELKAGEDLEQIVLEDLLRRPALHGDDHRVQQVGRDDVAADHRRAVDHHLHALAAQRGEPLVADGGGHHRLARELGGAEAVELVHRRDDDGALVQRVAQHVPAPLRQQRRRGEPRRHPLGDEVRAAGVQLKRVDRAEQLGHAELQHRVGEAHVLRVLRHRLHELAAGDAGEEQHARVVEVVAELGLRVAHRPLLQQVGQARAGGHRRAVGRSDEALGLAVDARADALAVLHEADADRRRLAVPLLDELARTREAAVGAETPHAQARAEETGGEIEVVTGRPEADADDGLHTLAFAAALRRGIPNPNDGELW
ncbi:MAG: hypothetical protein MUE62_13025 [Burkholderiaceae bacterium]|nr:hypothetical protein [Burkholderiaceae bacterium]